MRKQEFRKWLGTFLVKLGSRMRRGPCHHYAVAYPKEGEPVFYVDGRRAKAWPWDVDNVPTPNAFGRWSLLPFDDAVEEMLIAAKHLFAQPREPYQSRYARWDWGGA